EPRAGAAFCPGLEPAERYHAHAGGREIVQCSATKRANLVSGVHESRRSRDGIHGSIDGQRDHSIPESGVDRAGSDVRQRGREGSRQKRLTIGSDVTRPQTTGELESLPKLAYAVLRRDPAARDAHLRLYEVEQML